jgi:hypothetical protein
MKTLRLLWLAVMMTVVGCGSPTAPRVTCANATLRDNPEMFQKYQMLDAAGNVVLEYWVCLGPQ